MEAMRIHGKDWDAIEEYVGTRDATHCRSHAQKFFTKLLKYHQLSAEERAMDPDNYIEDAEFYLEILKRRIEKPMRKKKKEQMKQRQKELENMAVGQGQTLEDEEDIIKRKIALGKDLFLVEKDPSAVSKKQAQ